MVGVELVAGQSPLNQLLDRRVGGSLGIDPWQNGPLVGLELVPVFFGRIDPFGLPPDDLRDRAVRISPNQFRHVRPPIHELSSGRGGEAVVRKRVFLDPFRRAEGYPVERSDGIGHLGVEVEKDHVTGEPILLEATPVGGRCHQELTGGVDPDCPEILREFAVPRGHGARKASPGEHCEARVSHILQQHRIPGEDEHARNEPHFARSLTSPGEDLA